MMADMKDVNNQWNLHRGLRNKSLFISINKTGGKTTHTFKSIDFSSDKRTVSTPQILNMEERSWWKRSAVYSGRDYQLNYDIKFKIMCILTPDCYKCMSSKTHSIYQHLSFHFRPTTSEVLINEEGSTPLLRYSELLTPFDILIQQAVSVVSHVSYTAFSFISFKFDELWKLRLLSLVFLVTIIRMNILLYLF